jgi:hypothetical protein
MSLTPAEMGVWNQCKQVQNLCDPNSDNFQNCVDQTYCGDTFNDPTHCLTHVYGQLKDFCTQNNPLPSEKPVVSSSDINSAVDGVSREYNLNLSPNQMSAITSVLQAKIQDNPYLPLSEAVIYSAIQPYLGMTPKPTMTRKPVMVGSKKNVMMDVMWVLLAAFVLGLIIFGIVKMA